MIKIKLKSHGTEVEYEGEEAFLKARLPKLLALLGKSTNQEVKQGLLEIHDAQEAQLATLQACAANMGQLLDELAGQTAVLHGQTMTYLQSVATSSGDMESLFAATREMQEMQMSFNLQYLMLQNKISHENRQFTMVSNIMKNKHDTAKASINNIR